MSHLFMALLDKTTVAVEYLCCVGINYGSLTPPCGHLWTFLFFLHSDWGLTSQTIKHSQLNILIYKSNKLKISVVSAIHVSSSTFIVLYVLTHGQYRTPVLYIQLKSFRDPPFK